MSCAVTLVRGISKAGSKQQPIAWLKKTVLPMAPFPGMGVHTPLPPFVPGADDPDGREVLVVQAIAIDAVKDEVVCVLPQMELPEGDHAKMEAFLKAAGWEQYLPSQIVKPPAGLHLM